MMSTSTVLINIVLYYPDKDKVLALINACLQYEESKILLFDNTENSSALALEKSDGVISFQSPKNVGVAGAYYTACQMAEAESFDFVLFLDQDSQLPPDFIKNMVLGFYRLQKRYSRLSAIGPSWRDPRLFDWQQEKKLKNKLRTMLKAKLRDKLRLKNILISSGLLIWVPTLKNIGYPKREYFIDLVDTEWCLRALYKNYQVVLVEDVQMHHTIGEVRTIRKFILQYQNPVRYYYSIRNSFLLFSEKQIPFSFRLFILLRNILEIRKIPFVPRPRESFLSAWRGLQDGFLARKQYQSIA